MSGLVAFLLWAAARVARAPLTWIGVALLWSAWLLARVLRPVGLTTANSSAAGSFYELAFLGALLGTILALGPVEDCRWILQRTGPARRTWLEGAMLAAGALAGLALGALLPAALTAERAASSASFWAGSLLGILHLAALGLLVGRLPLADWQRPLALALLGWVLPAVAGEGLFTSWLDVARHWRAGAAPDTLGAQLRSLAGVAAPLVLALLVLPPAASGRARLRSPVASSR